MTLLGGDWLQLHAMFLTTRPIAYTVLGGTLNSTHNPLGLHCTTDPQQIELMSECHWIFTARL